jgi:predicted nucleotidyltransferase
MDAEQLKIELAEPFSRYREELIAAYLFGSSVTGLTSPSSDIDIALLMNNRNKTNGAALKFRLYSDICRQLKRNDVDLVLLNLSGNLVLNDEIVRYGKVLYSTDDTAREEFERMITHQCTDFKFQRLCFMGV